MLSVDPPDEDDSDSEQQGQQPQHTGTPRPGGISPRPTMEITPDGAAHPSKHLPDGLSGSGDGAPGHTVPMMNGDDKGVIEIDGEGDAEPSNFDKESPSSVSVSCFMNEILLFLERVPVAEWLRSLTSVLLIIRSTHRCGFAPRTGHEFICETSHVLLAGVSGGFSPGTPVFAPPTD